MAYDDSATIELGGLVKPSGKVVALDVLSRNAYRACRDHWDLAEDVIQESAIRLLKLKGAHKINNPPSYAARVVWRVAQDLLQNEPRCCSIDDIDVTDESSAADSSSIFYNQEALDRCILCAEVLTAVRDSLDQRQQAVAELVYQGYSITEIANKLNISRVTVYKDLRRIKEVIVGLDPPDPPDDGGDDGGGSGGIRLPPIRGDPPGWTLNQGVQRVAVLSNLKSSKSKEVSDDLEDVPKGGCMPRYARAHRQRARLPRPSDAEASSKTVLEDFKRLLLQLPAFREAGLSSSQEPDVQDLEDVLSLVVHQRRR